MAYLDLLSTNHKSTQRDYLGRVNDKEFPKHIAAQLAKQWGYDYWDGDRRINYGGYHYREGYWDSVASRLADHYSLKSGDKVLDIGCGKGFLLYDMLKLVPGLQVFGLDISEYAIQNAKMRLNQIYFEVMQLNCLSKKTNSSLFFRLIPFIT